MQNNNESRQLVFTLKTARLHNHLNIIKIHRMYLRILRTFRNFIPCFAFFFIFASASQATESVSTAACDLTQLTGSWDGKYFQGSTVVGFSLDLTSDGQEITGSSIERESNNTNAQLLTASWSGSINGSTLTLLKKYTGHSSSITYTANCNGNYETISGNWKISFLNKGDFILTKRAIEKPNTDQPNASLASTPSTIALSDLSFKDATPIVDKTLTTESFNYYERFPMVNPHLVLFTRINKSYFLWIPDQGHLIPISPLDSSTESKIMHNSFRVVDGKQIFIVQKTGRDCKVVTQFYEMDGNGKMRVSPEMGDCKNWPLISNNNSFVALELKHITDVDVYAYANGNITKNNYPIYKYIPELERRVQAGAAKNTTGQNNSSVSNTLPNAVPTLTGARYSPKPPTDLPIAVQTLELQAEDTDSESTPTRKPKKHIALPPAPKKFKDFKKPTSETHSISF